MDVQQRIAIIFDFDDTLAPDSTSEFLESIGIDTEQFWNSTAQMQLSHWDPIPAYLYQMLQVSAQKNITRSKLSAWGPHVPLYPGVTEIFDLLRERLQELSREIELEFYIISSGIEDIIKTTPIAHHFTDIWACDFHCDEQEKILFPKRIVSFTDKTRYIFHIAKGLIGPESRGKPFDVNRKFKKEDLRIPPDQMIFVGDGYTDVPCFSLIRKNGGIPLAVCDTSDRQRWGRAWGFMEEKRVIHWATADYKRGSTLYASLMMALETIANRMMIKQRTYQG